MKFSTKYSLDSVEDPNIIIIKWINESLQLLLEKIMESEGKTIDLEDVFVIDKEYMSTRANLQNLGLPLSFTDTTNKRNRIRRKKKKKNYEVSNEMDDEDIEIEEYNEEEEEKEEGMEVDTSIIIEDEEMKQVEIIEYKEGVVCEALYRLDGLIYPAEIRGIIEEEGETLYLIKFLGYNNIDQVPLTWLRPLSPEGKKIVDALNEKENFILYSQNMEEEKKMKKKEKAMNKKKMVREMEMEKEEEEVDEEEEEENGEENDNIIEDEEMKQVEIIEYKEGVVCEALYRLDGLIYPAEIRGIIEEEGETLYLIKFLGYNNIDQVPLTWLRPLSPEGKKIVDALKELKKEKEVEEEEIKQVNKKDGKKKEKKKKKKNISHSSEAPNPFSPLVAKYWSQRYRYFTKYNDGVILDEQGWYSATPEAISAHVADRARCDLIIDAFCGVGGSAIQLALTCERVIAIDIRRESIEMAKHNAKIYGVSDRIEFICGDSLKLLPTMKAEFVLAEKYFIWNLCNGETFENVVLLAPPWGGPGYLDTDIFDLDTMVTTPGGGSTLFSIAKKVTPNIIYQLPRNVNVHQVAKLDSTGEFERNYLNSKLKLVHCYFGDLVC